MGAPHGKQCLESWKAIAGYLGRSVRTVRRWETAEGLPIHRHRHGRGSSVMAYTGELDAWRLARLTDGKLVTLVPRSPLSPRVRRILVASAALAALFLAAWGARVLLVTGQGSPATTELIAVHPEAAVRARLFPVYQAWIAGEPRRGIAELEQVAAETESWPEAARDARARGIGELYLAMGRLETAANWFARIREPTARRDLVALTLLSAGQAVPLRQHLARTGADAPLSVLLLALSGGEKQARAALQSLETQPGVSVPRLEVIRGLLALAEGRTAEATEHLEFAVQELSGTGEPMFFIGADLLADVLWMQGERQRAIEALERTTHSRNAISFSPGVATWTVCQLRLANRYRELRRTEEARRIESRLRRMLAMADPDHPVLAALREPIL